MIKRTIFVNSELREVEFTTEKATLESLAMAIELTQTGVAMALNEVIIPKARWAEVELHNNDKVVIIVAACGG